MTTIEKLLFEKLLVEAGAREQRAVTLNTVEFRADEEDGRLSFRGHAAVFDEWTEIPSAFGGAFMERVQRGAFRKVLSDGADVRFLINHEGLPLARTASGTMRLKEDAKGLLVEADLADTTIARDLAVLLERRDISQMSFGFRVGKHEIEQDEDTGEVRRTILEFSDLFDVSPVTFPAYEGTDAAMRACGVDLTGPDGLVIHDDLVDVALKVFRGDIAATELERRLIERAFEKTDGVAPWIAEQAARATVLEPELRAALSERGVTLTVVDLSQDAADDEDRPPVGADRRMSVSAARARLDLLAA